MRKKWALRLKTEFKENDLGKNGPNWPGFLWVSWAGKFQSAKRREKSDLKMILSRVAKGKTRCHEVDWSLRFAKKLDLFWIRLTSPREWMRVQRTEY